MVGDVGGETLLSGRLSEASVDESGAPGVENRGFEEVTLYLSLLRLSPFDERLRLRFAHEGIRSPKVAVVSGENPLPSPGLGGLERNS